MTRWDDRRRQSHVLIGAGQPSHYITPLPERRLSPRVDQKCYQSIVPCENAISSKVLKSPLKGNEIKMKECKSY